MIYPPATAKAPAKTIAKRRGSNNTCLSGWRERIKMAVRYWAIQIIMILYPLTTEKRPMNFSNGSIVSL